MNIKAWLKYEEAYLPPRCRKNRYRECEEYIDIPLAECTMGDLMLAFEDRSYEGKGKIYYRPANASLWTKANMRDICCGGEEEHGYHTPLQALIWWYEHGSHFFATAFDREHYGKDTSRSVMIEKAQKEIDAYLLVDGELYIKTRVPYYVIMTFGCGNNHGGTGLFVEYGQHEMDYDALHGKDAVADAIKTAKNRGDTDSIPLFKEMITVYMPELVKQKEPRNEIVEIEKKIEDAIFELYRKYDLGLNEQQKYLKTLCMSDIYKHPSMTDALKEDWQLEHYIIQTALMNMTNKKEIRI